MAMLFFMLVTLFAFSMWGCDAVSDDDDDDDNDGDDDDDNGDDDDDDSSSGEIYKIQQGEIPEGTIVTLTGVIATSWLNVEKSAFYVQESDGGQYSGMYIYVYSEVLEIVEDIEPGDIVTLTGEYTEFYDLSEVTVKGAGDIEITGFTDAPTPEVVNAADIATGGSLSEAYESVLVAVEDVTVSEGVNTYGEWIVDGGLKIDDFFYYSDPSTGDTFESVAGPLLYSYDEFKLIPRSADDLDGDWTPSDDDDDDSTDVDIYDIQDGGVAEDSYVNVSGVIVTSPMSTLPPGFFVQESAGGEYSGIFVYVENSAKAVAVSPGDVVDLTSCQYVEYYGLSELKCDESDIEVTGTDTVPAPEVVNAADIATGGSLGENYEGVLVKVETVTCDTEADSYGQWVTTDGLMVDDLFFVSTPTSGDAFASITGPLHYTYDDFKIEPRSAADLVAK